MADKNTEIDSLYESMHQKDMAAIERKIAAAYRKAAEEASKLADIQIPGTSKAFSIDDYPQLKKKVSEILEDLHNRLQTIIVNGVESQWTLANNKNNELSRTVFGDNIGNLSEQQYSRYFSNNSNALQSFIMRTEAGLNLSQRVWKYTGAFKTEIEAALSIGIGTGKPAAEIAREVKSYLQNPDKLFRRVRDEKGNLKLSKAARNYHPGQGVYRSSYMNARRLAVTETNIAYRTSDYMRWQQLDFVVGIRICLSNNHNCRGVPAGTFRDICDQLSAPNKSTNTSGRGCYPKDFKFTGWHPHCRCHAITILKTDEEIAEDNRRFMEGKEPSTDSVNTIKDVPDGFKQWVRDNKDRITAAERKGKLPYFLKDNENTYKGILGIKPSATRKVPTIQDRAAIRHAARTQEQISDIKHRWTLRNAEVRHANRTPEQEQAIIKAWNDRKATRKYGQRILSYMDGISDVDTTALRKALNSGNADEILKEAQKLKAVGKEILSYSYLDNPMQVARQFSMADVKAVNEAVQKKLDGWAGLSLEKQKSKLSFEIDWVQKHQKYSTWEVAQNAYKKQLEKVSDALDWENIGNEFKSISSFKTKSQPYLDLVAKLQEAISSKDKAVAQQTILDIKKKREQLDKAAAQRKKSKFKSQFGEDAYSQSRKDAAVWDRGDGSKADAALVDTASENWRKASKAEKDYTHEYTHHYCDVNEPLQGRRYCNHQSKSRFIEKVNNITSYIEKNELPVDMWFTRGDDGLSVIRSRIEFAGGKMPSDLQDLVGMVMQEGGFMSTGSRKGKGFSNRSVILNIYAPKGTKAAYIEPISVFGNGAGRDWDGVQRFNSFSAEHETLFQRGTQMRITKVYEENGKIYIDCEVVGQEIKDLSYVKDSDIGY